jgi:mannosyltransferase
MLVRNVIARPFALPRYLWRRRRTTKVRILFVFFALLFLETVLHARSLRVNRPASQIDSDSSFQYGCTEPNEKGPRANATILMLARNKDVKGALQAIESLERHFNRWFKYPILFLNNEPWDDVFVNTLSNATSGEVSFDVIPPHMWSIPDWIDPEKVQKSMRKQEGSQVLHGGEASYHHMCRLYSGMFYDVPAIQKYRWFWRVEPDAEFTCSITYDPFIKMEEQGKKYGYTMALWEVGSTVPSLFRLVEQYRREHQLGSELWNAMLDPAWLPWPFRQFLSYFPHHTADGDFWNFCHYWSNFEIADLDFFRSKQYRDFFEYLDSSGGFYFERVCHSFGS